MTSRAIKHVVNGILLHHEGRLQKPFFLSEIHVRHHGDSHGFPISVRQVLPLPAVKQASSARNRCGTDTGPKLPRAVSRLPDSEIDGLLFSGCVFAQIRIAGYLPELPFYLGDENRLAGLQHESAQRKGEETQ